MATSCLSHYSSPMLSLAVPGRGAGPRSRRATRVHGRRGPHGLYLCRELAQMHGGELTAQSELGKGSTFRLSLPLG